MAFVYVFLWTSIFTSVQAARLPVPLDSSGASLQVKAVPAAPGPTYPTVLTRGLGNAHKLYSPGGVRQPTKLALLPQSPKGSQEPAGTTGKTGLDVQVNKSATCDPSRNAHVSPQFVTTRNGSIWFYLGETEFHFAGTNAYYLMDKEMLSDEDLRHFFCLQACSLAPLLPSWPPKLEPALDSTTSRRTTLLTHTFCCRGPWEQESFASLLFSMEMERRRHA
jgi:hypothetical protein